MKYTCFVENEHGEMVAFGVAAPSIANALKKSGGKLFPFGAFRVLKACRKMIRLTCSWLRSGRICREAG